MNDPGHDEYIVDEPLSPAEATATDTCYLLSTSDAAPAAPTPVTALTGEDPQLDAEISAFFTVAGSGSTMYLQGIGDAAPAAVTIQNAGATKAITIATVTPGTALNGYTITVAADETSGFDVTLKDGTNATVHAFTELANMAAIATAFASPVGGITFAVTGDTTDTSNPALGTSMFAGGVAGSLPSLANALLLLPEGPGQVVAPSVVTSPDMITMVEGTWTPQNKCCLFSGPSNATDAALATLAAAVIGGCDARGAAMFGDYYLMPRTDGSGNDQIPASVIVSALIARNDLQSQNAGLPNPNIAAAGLNGEVDAAVGVLSARTGAAISAMKTAQVNSAKILAGGIIRNYGFRTLADLSRLPMWWDFSGSRTVMAYRALASAVDEDFVFAGVDGGGITMGRYQSRLETVGSQMQKAGALYGNGTDPGYSVDTGSDVNPLTALQNGQGTGRVKLKTSPFIEHLVTDITRVGLTGSV